MDPPFCHSFGARQSEALSHFHSFWSRSGRRCRMRRLPVFSLRVSSLGSGRGRHNQHGLFFLLSVRTSPLDLRTNPFLRNVCYSIVHALCSDIIIYYTPFLEPFSFNPFNSYLARMCFLFFHFFLVYLLFFQQSFLPSCDIEKTLQYVLSVGCIVHDHG